MITFSVVFCPITSLVWGRGGLVFILLCFLYCMPILGARKLVNSYSLKSVSFWVSMYLEVPDHIVIRNLVEFLKR